MRIILKSHSSITALSSSGVHAYGSRHRTIIVVKKMLPAYIAFLVAATGLITPARQELLHSPQQKQHTFQSPPRSLAVQPNSTNLRSMRQWLPEMGRNRPDDRLGYQIQLVYVDTSSRLDIDYDINGDISKWVSQATVWLWENTSRQFIYDTYNGNLDVPYLQINYDIKSNSDSLDALISLYVSINKDSYAGKTIVFIVNQSLDTEYCGFASRNDGVAVVFVHAACAPNERFTTLNKGLSYPASTLIHELIHTYGASHVCVDDTDLMIGSPQCPSRVNWSKPVTFDASRTQYYGANLAGVDLNTLKIWSDGAGLRRPELPQSCWRNESCLLERGSFNSKSIISLQVKKGKVWKTVATYASVLDDSSTYGYKWKYVITYTFPKGGKFLYRLYVPGNSKFRAYVGPQESKVVVN